MFVPYAILFYVVKFVEDQDISFTVKIGLDGTGVIYADGLIGRHKPVLPSARVGFIRGGPDRKGVIAHGTEKRIQKIPFSLVLEGAPGRYPTNSIRLPCGDQAPCNDGDSRLSTSRGDVKDYFADQ